MLLENKNAVIYGAGGGTGGGVPRVRPSGGHDRHETAGRTTEQKETSDA